MLTAAQQEQIYLLHYLNRTRERPYSQRFGAQPVDVRIKPNSGHLELDVELSTSYNFNKYQGLKWGDAVQAAKTIQNESGTGQSIWQSLRTGLGLQWSAS
jgi:DNA-directed RNA polymerase-3 subunit RPC5